MSFSNRSIIGQAPWHIFYLSCFKQESVSEAVMNDAEMKRQNPSGENSKDTVHPQAESSSEHTDAKEHIHASVDPKSILSEIEHFFRLSSDMKDCLLSMIQKTKDAVDVLKVIQHETESKKEELKQIHDIEASAVALEKLAEEHQRQKEKFKTFIEEQRRQWAEEKALKEKAETEYWETLNRSRQQEIQEYQKKLSEEKSFLRKKMEEELSAVLHEGREKQKEIVEELNKRERALKDKERECGQLIHELEKYLTGLAARAGQGNKEALSFIQPSKKKTVPTNAWFPPADDLSTGSIANAESLQKIREDLI